MSCREWLDSRWFTGVKPQGNIEVAPHVYAHGEIRDGELHVTSFNDAHLGMYALGLSEAFWHGNPIDFDPEIAEWLIEKQFKTVMSKEPIELCEKCLKLERTSHKHCRLCEHVEPTEDGSWYCNKLQGELHLGQQIEGCKHHLTHDKTPNNS